MYIISIYIFMYILYVNILRNIPMNIYIVYIFIHREKR